MTTGPSFVQVAHGWPPERIGGVELYVATLHGALIERGADSSVFVAGARDQETPDRCQVQGPDPAPRSFRDGFVRPGVEARFRAWLDQRRPEIVHFHHLAHLSLGLPRIAAERGAVPLMTLHDYHLLCPRGQLVDRDLRRCAGPEPERCARCVAGQLALTPATAWLGKASSRLPQGLRSRGRELLGRARRGLSSGVEERQRLVAEAVGCIHRFASPSRDLAQRVAGLGIPAERIDLVELPLVHPVQPAPPAGSGPLRLLFLGSMIPTKSPHSLVEAFASLPPGAATLHLAGPRPQLDLDPGYARRLEARVAGLPGASIEGAFAPGQVQSRLDAADVLVVPSRWEENSPLVVREASAAGLRVVAARRGGIAELVPKARFFEPNEPGALERALLAELRAGRGREPPRRWDDPARHAGRVLDWYHASTSNG